MNTSPDRIAQTPATENNPMNRQQFLTVTGYHSARQSRDWAIEELREHLNCWPEETLHQHNREWDAALAECRRASALMIELAAASRHFQV